MKFKSPFNYFQRKHTPNYILDLTIVFNLVNNMKIEHVVIDNSIFLLLKEVLDSKNNAPDCLVKFDRFIFCKFPSNRFNLMKEPIYTICK